MMMTRKTMIVNLLVLSVSVISAASTAIASSAAEMDGDSNQNPSGHIRGWHQRRMPGYETMNIEDLDSAELGFAAGILFAFLLICFLLCMCCGGGSRCSLWDCLALVCIWEMCCDGRSPTDFVRI
uniref:Uncharacterized protein n=1 Tax=Amphora coffeiformis TaxID=265554 RepID=A0A7S3KWI4_9STRA